MLILDVPYQESVPLDLSLDLKLLLTKLCLYISYTTFYLAILLLLVFQKLVLFLS